jgi:hypothetical protein
MRLALALLIVVLGLAPAHAAEWRNYVDPTFGYSVTIPEDGFDVEVGPANNGLTLYERNGHGQIDVYGIRNDDGLTLTEMKVALSKADRIEQITYGRAGHSWLVVSGYYKRPASHDTDLIFYAKFMISKDRKSIAAFEASYPLSEKRRFDPIIERMEDSLTRPE